MTDRDELIRIISDRVGHIGIGPAVELRKVLDHWLAAHDAQVAAGVIDWIENRSPHTLLVAVGEAREHFAPKPERTDNA